MLARRNRLSANSRTFLFRFGKRSTSIYFNCWYALEKQHPSSSPRFFIQVPKKVYRRAVDRNRAKRLIAEVLQQALPEIDVSSLVAIKVIRPFPVLRFIQLSEELRKILQSAQVVQQK